MLGVAQQRSTKMVDEDAILLTGAEHSLRPVRDIFGTERHPNTWRGTFVGPQRRVTIGVDVGHVLHGHAELQQITIEVGVQDVGPIIS